MSLGFVKNIHVKFPLENPQNKRNSKMADLMLKKKICNKIKKTSMKMSKNEKEISSKKYLSWLSENNVYVSSKSTWGRPPHPCVVSDETIDEGESSGRGLIAFKNIQQNEKIIEIPESIIITENNEEYQIQNPNLLNEYDRIAIFLIKERSKGEKSSWKPYLDTLPVENDLKLVFRWKMSDIAFLNGSKILLATTYLKKKIDFQFNNVQKNVFEKNKLIFPEEIFNLMSWEWAMTILFSRAIYLQNSKKISLVPYADLLNHNPFSTSYIDSKSIPFSNSLEISMYADRSYNKFDQVFTTYGPKTNLELLILYGFSLERNPFESYEIRVGLSQNDTKFSQKKNFIEDCGKTSEITFPIFLYQYPKELYEFMAFCLLPGSNLNEEEFYFAENENLDETKEIDLIKKVLSYACKKNLIDYPVIRNESEILDIANNSNFLSKNQKISLRQRKIEKKILTKLIEI